MRTVTRLMAISGIAAVGIVLGSASVASAAPAPPSSVTVTGATSAATLSVGTGGTGFTGAASSSFTQSGFGNVSFGSFARPGAVGTFGPR